LKFCDGGDADEACKRDQEEPASVGTRKAVQPGQRADVGLG
jgi:hypothetical protein